MLLSDLLHQAIPLEVPAIALLILRTLLLMPAALPANAPTQPTGLTNALIAAEEDVSRSLVYVV
jgi:hypothetical protein